MRFKVDENLPDEVAELLRQAGHDATTIVEEALGGTRDPQISLVCQQESRALITLDMGFADIRYYPPNLLSGTVVLRVKSQDKQTVLTVVSQMIPNLAEHQLTGKLWIVEEDRIRIR